ncbi:hypothetical protein DINM_004877 [Dirofilaria immitis]|nr:hypothetical protein [Dirofilaria immitis]
MNAAVISAFTSSIWLLSSFSTFTSASIICMSCATKHAVTHWNKFMNYRVMNSHTGTLMDDHPCESPHNQTCNAMAQGCSVGLFDNSARCFDRPIIWRGRGGNFNLDGHYCLCDGDLCNRNSEKFVQYDAKNFYTQRQKAGKGKVDQIGANGANPLQINFRQNNSQVKYCDIKTERVNINGQYRVETIDGDRDTGRKRRQSLIA